MNLGVLWLMLDRLTVDKPYNYRREMSDSYGQSYLMTQTGSSVYDPDAIAQATTNGGGDGDGGGGAPDSSQPQFLQDRIKFIEETVATNRQYRESYRAHIDKAKEYLGESGAQLSKGGDVESAQVVDIAATLKAQSAALDEIQAATRIRHPGVPDYPTSTLTPREPYPDYPSDPTDAWIQQITNVWRDTPTWDEFWGTG